MATPSATSLGTMIYARVGSVPDELPEVAGHGTAVVSDQNPARVRDYAQHIGISNSPQTRLLGGLKVELQEF
jgi:hypothetical protein